MSFTSSNSSPFMRLVGVISIHEKAIAEINDLHVLLEINVTSDLYESWLLRTGH